MITDVPIPAEAHSLCWVCRHYNFEILISIKGARPQIEHICKKNQQASDDVWECKNFKRKRKKMIDWWEFVPIPPRLFIWRPQKTRSKDNIEI